MKAMSLCVIPWMILGLSLSAGEASAQQQKAKLGENAALRYWAAIGQMTDQAIGDEEVKELNEILKGKIAYDDLKFRDLVEKNRPALETMARGTTLANCDWGLEYAQGLDVQFPYSAKAVALARLNVLYAFHLQSMGDKEGSVRALVAGWRFSHDIANGAPMIIATLLAKVSLANHLVAIASIVQTNGFSPQQRSILRKALVQFGSDPLDWKSPMTREIEGFKMAEEIHSRPWPCSLPPARFAQYWAGIVDDASTLPEFEKIVASQPKECRDFFPNAKRILDARQELNGKLGETLFLLQ
jgi:hypothetical protein